MVVEGDLVLCKVEKVSNTITFVRLPDNSEGTIISSEIAPGRIKHMRHYVVPNKQVVCKILEVSGDHIHLSLRRVSSREKKEVFQAHKQEKAFSVALRQILGDSSVSIVDSIVSKFGSLSNFVSSARDDSSVLGEFFSGGDLDSVKKVIDRKKKSLEIKKSVSVKCVGGDGLSRIKEVFDFGDDSLSINYVSAGNFSLKLIVSDFKEGKKKFAEVLESLEKRCKDLKCEFSVLD